MKAFEKLTHSHSFFRKTSLQLNFSFTYNKIDFTIDTALLIPPALHFKTNYKSA